MPNDQCLECKYNRPAKSVGGIIGKARRKEAMTQWDMTHHEKEAIRHAFDTATDSSEYSLHHEFSSTVAARGSNQVAKLKAQLLKAGNPFDRSFDGEPVKNFATGESNPKGSVHRY